MNSLNTQDGIDQWLLDISGLKRACIDEDDSKVNWYVLMTPGLQLLSNPTCCALLSYHACISFERRSGSWLLQLRPLRSPRISRCRYPFHAEDLLIGPWIWMLKPKRFSHGPIYVTRFPSTLLYSLQVNFPFVEPEDRGGLYIYLEKNLLVANVKDAYPVLVVFKVVNTSFIESAIITVHYFCFQWTHVISCCFQGNRFIELSQAYESIMHLSHRLGAQSKG